MKSAICILVAIVGLGLSLSAQLQTGLALKYLVQEPRVKTAHPPVLVLLHGYGSNETDLFELRKAFPANFLVVSVRAPLKADVGGYQWFEREITNGKYDGKREHLESSRNAILKFVSELTKKYGANERAIYLAGFSQGAMMCYETALTAPGKIRGIAVLSGKLPGSLPARRSAIRR